jgi:signal transduction histidine kinase/CheY-like chemotaxis protein
MYGPAQSFDPSRYPGTPGEPASDPRRHLPSDPRRDPPRDPPSAPAEAPAGPAVRTAAFRGSALPDLRHALHVCLVYERAAEARAAVVAFFAAGLAAGERCLYQGGGANWRRLERALATARLAAEAGGHTALGALGEIAGPPSGGPRAWLELVREAERRALADGFSGLRVSWEMPPEPGRWTLAEIAELAEMEELLDRVFAGAHTSLLCRYSRQRSPADLLQRVMHSHPAAMLGGEVGANVFYAPEPAVPGAPHGEERVQRMLAQLRRELRRERRLRDLERRLADNAVELDRADQDREQLLAMLGHELRNPLSTVSIALSVLRQRGARREGDETWRRALDTAERQVFHQAALVDDMLEASRATRGEIDLHLEPLDLARLVPDVVDAYRDEMRDAGLALDADLTPQALPVSGDRLRLWQAVAHLLQNALKFSPPGGRVRVRLRRSGEGKAEISVRDRGVGISPELLPHVFEVFTQADHTLDRAKGGLGIGLTVVKGVIEHHGGEVQASSDGEPGHGAEFKLLLPLDPASAASAPEATEAAGAAGGRLPAAPEARRVLVVEDHLDTSETLRDLLELSGFEVRIAGSGADGVAAARQFHPDVVLCDLGLPGMNGYEVASTLRRDPATAAARLIALTGYGSEEDRRRSHEAGFDIHLTKPVDPALLRRLLSAGGPASS